MSAIDHGHGDKALDAFAGGKLGIKVSLFSGDVAHQQRGLLLHHAADQTSSDFQVRPLPVLFARTFGGFQHEFVLLCVHEHDGAHTCLHHFGDHAHDQLQHFVEVLA